MSGVLNAMVGGTSPTRLTVTIGNSTVFYGYNAGGAFGAISSTAFRGQIIDNVLSTTGASQNDIAIVIREDLPQNFFGILQVQDTAGTVRQYTSASATRITFGSPVWTQWVWDNNSPVWTSTSPGSRALTLY